MNDRKRMNNVKKKKAHDTIRYDIVTEKNVDTHVMRDRGDSYFGQS